MFRLEYIPTGEILTVYGFTGNNFLVYIQGEWMYLEVSLFRPIDEEEQL